MEIKNLQKAAIRIKKAVERNESVILYGDSDLDGISSVIILKETIELLNKDIVKGVYFPDRENEGYGLTKKGLKFLKKYAPALLIVLDCGIRSFEEIKQAKKLGFKVIVIDHHQVFGALPEAEIIVDPKMPEDKSGYEYLATTGIVFKLATRILGKKINPETRKSFLELTAMATIADTMPRIKDNRIFIKEGLKSIEKSKRPGIKALFWILEKKDETFKTFPLEQKIEKVNSVLNIPEIENSLPLTFQLLTCADFSKAKKIVQKLYEKSLEKKREIKKVVDFLQKREDCFKDKPLIFEGRANWRLILLGTAASQLVELYKKPVFLFKRKKKESPGSVRAPSGFDVVLAMRKCQRFLNTFGGHAGAAGFRAKTKDLPKLKNCLIEFFSKKK